MSKFDYLIVGSGLYGATFACIAKRQGKRCLVIDKRPHLGGNVYCEQIEGINVHKYGPHIFHTSNKAVWDFVNSFVVFNRFTNSPIANYHGELYNLPFNMNTFCRMWPDVHTPAEAQARIDEQRQEAIAALNGCVPANLEEQALCHVGKDIFERLIKEYSEKQWGRDCKDLPAFLINRVPLRLTFDNNYFDERYQGIPVGGYNRLIDGLLEGVECMTSVDFFTDNIGDNDKRPLKDCWREYAERLVYTGPLDEYFNCCYGHLDWRTVFFKTRIEDTPNYQGNAVINYTSHEQPYTRIIEHKHFEMSGPEIYECPKTVVSEEYSTEYKEGMEQYYPVNDDRNNDLSSKYKTIARQQDIIFPEDIMLTNGEGLGGASILFGGRLAEYKYYDMAPIVESILRISQVI